MFTLKLWIFGLAKALIASVAWIIWKIRCNLIFKNSLINYNTIVAKAWSTCLDFNIYFIREFPKPSLSNNGIIIFTNASWCSNPISSGLGFIIIANMNHILLAGAMGAATSSRIMAEFVAINLAL